MNVRHLYIAAFAVVMCSCHSAVGKKPIDSVDIKKDVIELPLKDSLKLTRIKDHFYRSKSGQLFDRTFATKKMPGADTLGFVAYFNGKIVQTIDPLTFEQLDMFFAKDKNTVYNYRPTSGGMTCSIMDNADLRSFKIVEELGAMYGADNKHLFFEFDIVKGIDPKKMRFIKNKEGEVIKVISGRTIYKPD